MDIWAKHGHKVIFQPENNGYESENKDARAVLELDKVYTVDHVQVESWISYVQLVEVPNKLFNTVLFNDYGVENASI
ncbi:hypothetical protein [Pseudomonas phage Astolliot]|nr:hypothetical protein [Pseudomonas phage Astolliot]